MIVERYIVYDYNISYILVMNIKIVQVHNIFYIFVKQFSIGDTF